MGEAITLTENFKKRETNPLTDLSGLSMELRPNGEELDVHCQLRFATDEIEFSSRAYVVGIRQARLQLYLEGWDKKIGADYGDLKIPTVERSSKSVQETCTSGEIGGGGAASIAGDGMPTGSGQVGVTGNVKKSWKEALESEYNQEIPPITSLPNNAWQIKVMHDGSPDTPLEGTALSGERLCILSRTQGSNQSHVTAELQVRRSQITVRPSKGNKWGKMFSLSRNKDAIIAKVLEKAIKREAEGATARSLDAVVVASKVDFEEQ
ncbi:hypothetical protein FIU85_08770 [Roseovarius sp. THAF8]|uniref:hypothetical protein n=1 Tax=Roseovarius sp. THAF8 TaxID=2587846 RepID=UPI0012A84E71|nr:hypothetical protein [Roseovarius sp. THAF8]QFT97392.1 hypothetical protein FIU85_08770 [Roseovarius sp. THAF8]